MSGRRHLFRPRLSEATRARPNIASLDRQIAEAKRKGQTELVAYLEREKAWALVNSLTS